VLQFHSSYYGKESYINWITNGLDSFGKGTSRKRNIDWLKGVLFAVPKPRVGLVFMTFRSRIRPSSVSGFLSYSLRMGLGKPF
jgi:hypothetical protein